MSYLVYKHTNIKNGKIYVGITKKQPNQRWKNGEGYKKQNYFYNAIKKYGWNGFIHEILYTNLSIEEARLKEIELISKYKSNNKKYGYNITAGGDGLNGYKFTKEHSQNMSIAMRGKNTKRICQYNLDGKFLRTWDSIIEASNTLGIGFRTIADCCREYKHYKAGGYMWKFYARNTNDILPYKLLIQEKHVIQMDIDNNFIKEWDSKLSTPISNWG